MNYIKRLNNLQTSLNKIGKYKASSLVASVVRDIQKFATEEDEYDESFLEKMVAEWAEEGAYWFLESNWAKMPEYKSSTDKAVARYAKEYPYDFLDSEWAKKPEYKLFTDKAVAIWAAEEPGYFLDSEWSKMPEYKSVTDKAVVRLAEVDPGYFLETEWAEMPQYKSVKDEAVTRYADIYADAEEYPDWLLNLKRAKNARISTLINNR